MSQFNNVAVCKGVKIPMKRTFNYRYQNEKSARGSMLMRESVGTAVQTVDGKDYNIEVYRGIPGGNLLVSIKAPDSDKGSFPTSFIVSANDVANAAFKYFLANRELVEEVVVVPEDAPQ